MMIIFYGMHLIGLAIMLALFVICGIVIAIDNIVYAVKKRHKNKR